MRALIVGASAAAREWVGQDTARPEDNPLASWSNIGPPSSRRRRMAAGGVYGLFVAAAACLLLAGLNADLVLPAAWTPTFRLLCGAILLLGSLALVQTRIQTR